MLMAIYYRLGQQFVLKVLLTIASFGSMAAVVFPDSLWSWQLTKLSEQVATPHTVCLEARTRARAHCHLLQIGKLASP